MVRTRSREDELLLLGDEHLRVLRGARVGDGGSGATDGRVGHSRRNHGSSVLIDWIVRDHGSGRGRVVHLDNAALARHVNNRGP